MVIPLLALGPPFVAAVIPLSLESLVGITGGIAGAFIQYVFPALLVYCRREATKSREKESKQLH